MSFSLALTNISGLYQAQRLELYYLGMMYLFHILSLIMIILCF